MRPTTRTPRGSRGTTCGGHPTKPFTRLLPPPHPEDHDDDFYQQAQSPMATTSKCSVSDASWYTPVKSLRLSALVSHDCLLEHEVLKVQSHHVRFLHIDLREDQSTSFASIRLLSSREDDIRLKCQRPSAFATRLSLIARSTMEDAHAARTMRPRSAFYPSKKPGCVGGGRRNGHE